MSSKARRPYLMGKKSVTQFYQAPVRFLKEILGKESVFEKPYLDENYRKMHFDFPWPDWPPFPPFPPWPPIPPIPGPGPYPGCAIVCYEPLDCDEPIWCHPGIWCGEDLGCTLCTWVVEGATSGYTPREMFGTPWGIDVWIDTDLVESGGEALIKICMTDPCGNVCCHDSEITCKVCPPEVVMSWDSDLSATTIGRSTSVAVFVKDGLGPYSWEVTGTGFTMLHASTPGLENALVADATACGSATITVTDLCSGTATGYVRGTEASQWVAKQWDVCVFGGPATFVAGGVSAAAFEYIAGNKRQLETIDYDGGFAPGVYCATDAWRCDVYGCSGDTCLTGPFIVPDWGDIKPICMDNPDYPGAIRCYCGEENMDYYEWECT